MFIENFKNKVMAEEFRQDMLRHTSAEAYNIDDMKKPTYKAVNESFRKLNVD